LKRSIAAILMALTMVPFLGGAASASDVKQKVQCMFRQYIQEGGESGLDCLV
jgi:hypothetical protein